MKFTFDKWLLKKCDFHDKFNHGRVIPLRVMYGVIKSETEKCYYIEVEGKPSPSSFCLHCGRKITNKVSLYYGLGMICGKHYGISNVSEDNLDKKLEEIRAKLKSIKWVGLVPKKSVKVEEEYLYEIIFSYKGKDYRVVTSDETKVEEIKNKSDSIIDIKIKHI